MQSESNSRQAMWVAIGQFFAYAIGIISPMILSRYFDKSDYGTYKQVMYVYNTLLSVFTLGLPRAYSYFIPRVSLGESKDVVRKISRLFLLLGFLFSALLFLGSPLIADLLKNPNLELALKWFSPTPLLLLPVMGMDGILASYKKAGYIAIYTVLSRTFMLLCIVMPVLCFNGTYVHAIIGFDIASLLTFLLSLYLRELPTKNIDWEKTQVTYRQIFAFSLPLLTASLWIMVFHSVNQFFISRYYGTEVFAEFSNGFMDFPINQMILGAVATVLMPLFSGMAVRNKEEIGEVWNGALNKTIKLIYPMTVYCIMFAPLVMTCFYGRQYESSGIYFAIKSVEAFFTVIPFYPIVLALGKSKEYSNVHMVIAIVIVPLEYIIVFLGGTAYMIGIAYVACAIAKVVLQFKVVNKSLDLSFKELIPLGSMLKITGVSILAAMPAFILLSVSSEINEWIMLLVTLAAYVVVYYVLCWITRVSYKDIVISSLGQRLRPLVKYIP